jgi:hypothetical protein
MLKRHEARAEEFRGHALQAERNAVAAPLALVRERETRAAASWEALARLEDYFARSLADRLA